MAKAKEIPINPLVLRWAITESGLDIQDIATKLKIDISRLREWNRGDNKPGLTEFRKLCKILKRPTATFFLPDPPSSLASYIAFRHPPETQTRKLNYKEALNVRIALRIQRFLSWASKELKKEKIDISKFTIDTEPGEAAAYSRSEFKIDISTQFTWSNTSQAFRYCREILENRGIYIFLFQMGEKSIRGFSSWDDYAPIIVINTTRWTTEARIFSLFHELGHLLTRSNSACIGTNLRTLDENLDPIERWCERFASSTVMPLDELLKFLREEYSYKKGELINDLSIARSIKGKFKLSLTAVVLRLIDENLANWGLYNKLIQQIPKKPSYGPPRTSIQIKKDAFGNLTMNTFLEALNKELITKSEASSYLELSYDDVSKLRTNTI